MINIPVDLEPDLMVVTKDSLPNGDKWKEDFLPRCAYVMDCEGQFVGWIREDLAKFLVKYLNEKLDEDFYW